MRALVLLASCAALSAGVASAAAARPGIGLDWRIGAAHYVEVKSRVDAALGPSKVVHGYGAGTWLFYGRAKLIIGYVTDHGNEYVGAIITRSSRYKTRAGIGVGSTLRQLRHGIKVSCYSDHHECQHAPANNQHPYTVFNFDPAMKRVAAIEILPGGG